MIALHMTGKGCPALRFGTPWIGISVIVYVCCLPFMSMQTRFYLMLFDTILKVTVLLPTYLPPLPLIITVALPLFTLLIQVTAT